MKKSKLLAVALAATVFTTAACALVACGDDNSAGKTYTVTFDADGGTLSGSQTLKTDKNGIVQGAIPTADKAGNTFNGWSLSKGDDTVINFKSQKFTGDRVVYAVYTPGAGEVTITFDYGEGSGSPASAQTVNGKLDSLPTPTPPQECLFNGWYTAKAGGEYVTVNTTFDQSCTIYARYKSTIAERNNYCYVGSTKYMLTAATLADAEQAYTVNVELNEGDTISFYVDVELIEAQRGAVWLGMEPVAVKTSEFTAAKQGTFDFTLAYYATGEWKIEADDGTIPFQADHYYLVGGDFGWSECSADGYIGETSGEFELTVGETPVTFKIAKCANGKTGGILWDDSVLDVNCVTTGLGYVSTDGDNNIVLKAAGTYTITLNNGNIEITTDDFEEPEINIYKDHYYLVGLGAEYGNWATCLEKWHVGETSGEIELTVGEEESVTFKLVKCKNVWGAFDWDDSVLDVGAVTAGLGYVTPDADGNIVLEAAATYKITLNDGSIEISTDDIEEPEIKIFVNHYYFVGGDIGWTACVEDGYLGATSGEIEVTVGEDREEPFAFKVVKCNSVAGGIDWDSALGTVTVGKGYVTTDVDGNFVLAAAGTYTIKLVNGKIEITSDDVEEPEVEDDTAKLVPVQTGNQDATHPNVYLIKNGDKTQGYLVKYEKDENGYVQYKITIDLQAGDKVAIYIPDSDLVCTTLENTGIETTAETKNGNIEIKSAKTYTFYFKTKTGDSKIWLAW